MLTKIKLGIAVIDRKRKVARTGHAYSAGTKLYPSLGIARNAVRSKWNKDHDLDQEYLFVPIEIEVDF